MSISIYCDTCEEYINLEDNTDSEFTCTKRTYCPISETFSDDDDYKELDFNE